MKHFKPPYQPIYELSPLRIWMQQFEYTLNGGPNNAVQSSGVSRKDNSITFAMVPPNICLIESGTENEFDPNST